MTYRTRVSAHCAAILLAVLAAPLQAQQPVPLDGLVITANRWADPEWTVAAHATVIDGAELEQAGIEFVADALRRVPGLIVVRGGSFGAITSVFLRGAESDHMQVLVDGVTVNEPGGAFDFSALTTDNIERIEIIRGPASALYGSDAVAGVIQIFTRRGAGAPTGELSVQAGSYGTRRWQAGVSGGTGTVSYSLGVGSTDSDGILEFNNSLRQRTATARVQGYLDANTDATVAARYDDRTYHFPTDGTGSVTDRNAYTFGDALSLNLDAGRRWTDALETRFSYSVYESDNGSEDEADSPADTLGFYGYSSLNDIRRTVADLRAIWRTSGGTAIATGYELEQQEIRAFSQSLSQYGTSPARSHNERSNRAFYTQLSLMRGGLALNGGVRAEDNERFGSAATWRAGAAWRPAGSGTRLRMSAGSGIKEPTFFETYAAGFATGNPELEPERSLSVEAGADQELGEAVTVSLTAFNQSYEDLIQYTFSTPAPGAPNFHNVARARSRGVEAEAAVRAGRLAATGSYTWLDTRVEDSGFDEGPGATFVEGGPLIRRPEHSFAATAFAQLTAMATLEMAARHTGKREDRDFAGFPAAPVVLPGHTVVDVALNLELWAPRSRPGFTLTLRAENVFDEDYEEVWGFRSPGRGLYLGGRVEVGGPPEGSR